MAEPILIRRTTDPYGWMSNMSPYSVGYYGHEYLTTEALFQCLRFPDLGSDICEAVRGHLNPMQAKLEAKSHTEHMSVEMLSEQDLENMRLCLRLKLDQHPHLKDELRKTGDRPILEDCTNRQVGSGLFWGAAPDPDWNTTRGENWLGKLWMELRAEL
jgi:ribA/ribD-fused uncharacterized protein